MYWIKMTSTCFDGLDELYHHAKFGEDRTTRAGCRCENVVFVFVSLLVTGYIKFTQCVSGQKSAFSPLQEKLCAGSKNEWHLLELSGRSLPACKVWGRSNYARQL